MTTTTGFPNRYPGYCAGCSTYVYRGKGIYHNGNLWCEEPTLYGSAHSCAEGHKIDERQRAASLAVMRQSAAERAARVPTAEELERQEQRAEQDRRWAARGLTRCKRCSGAGGASQWPGFTCYECGGTGCTSTHDHN